MKYAYLGIIFLFFISCKDQAINNPPPPAYDLKQNYPNPFTDTTWIIYGVPSVGPNATGPWVRVVIKDRFNQTEATLVDTHNHPAGYDTVIWTGRGANYQKVPAGIYYIELQQLTGGDVYVQGRQIALKQ
jgi:hypothetical protein